MTMAPYEDINHSLVPATCRSADRAVLTCTTQNSPDERTALSVSEPMTFGFTPELTKFCGVRLYRSGQTLGLIRWSTCVISVEVSFAVE